jgi:hypothetical protein
MSLQRNGPGQVNEAGKRAVSAGGAPAPGLHDRPPEQDRAGLGRAVRIVDAGPRYFYRSALVSLAATCLLAILIAVDVRPPGPLPRPQQAIIAAALAGLCLVVLLVLAGLVWPPGRRGPGLDHIAAAGQRAAVWLALTAWFPLLLVVAYFRAEATLPPSVVWIAFGYLDKRWVTSAYLVGVLAPMLLLVAAARVLAAGREHPPSWRSWLSGLAPRRRGSLPADTAPPDVVSPDVVSLAGPARAAWRRLARAPAARAAARVLTPLGIAWYFYGPPWYLSRPGAGGVIGFQEDVFLSGFQAISKGAIPYLGPASVQYGPGTQLLSYFYMRHIGTFSVVGFRESWATFQWAGATILFVVFFLAFGYLRGLVATLLSVLIYPTASAMGFRPGGSYGGLFGWSDPLRYAGAIALILLLPAVIRLHPARRGLAGAAGLGVLFGATSYLAQENLIGGVVGALAVSALLLLTGSSSFRSVATALLAALAGFLVVWIPVLVFYAVHGALARFMHLYFLIPQAVAGGYSNTPYGGHQITAAARAAQARWETFFYALPFILAVAALLVVVQFRPFRVASEWSRERVGLVAIVITEILLYQGALLRSDASHLYGTVLAAPGLVIMAATVLPRLLGAWRPVTLAVAGVAMFAASFLLLPRAAVSPSGAASLAAAPYRDRQRLAGEAAPAAPTTVAGLRVGAGLAASRQCCQDASVPMTRFMAFMDHLHAIIGGRVTYVVSFPAGYPGLVYFAADLTPAPVPVDVHTMVMNVPQYRAYLADFRSSVLPRTGALVTPSLGAAEARDFRDFYRNARLIALTYRGKPLYVLIR